jgi:DNA-binding response OmpR family regulator
LAAQSPPPQRPETLTLGKLRIDLGQHRVWVKDSPIQLSAKEFRLLACLASQEGRVVPLQDLIRETHSLRVDRQEAGSLLRPLIRSLRRKLGYTAGEMGCIANVRGVGYQLVSPAKAQARREAVT